MISWVRLCWSVWLMLSMSLVTRRQDVAAGLAVEVGERQPAELLVDPLAQAVTVRWVTPAMM